MSEGSFRAGSGAGYRIESLLGLMRALRDPVNGCPWDRDQNFESIARYTIEEAYEVADAIARGGAQELRDELGDLLLQVVFHAQMASEAGAFSFSDVVRAICEKMIRRHPHVFGQARSDSAEDVKANWEALKQSERAEKQSERGTSALDGIPLALPALTRADKLTKRAALSGFDWPDTAQVLEKIVEEAGEVAEAKASGDADALEDEMGDLLFVVANLARHLKVDPEAALRRTNAKFTRRFQDCEAQLIQHGLKPETVPLTEWGRLWDAVKAEEKRARK